MCERFALCWLRYCKRLKNAGNSSDNKDIWYLQNLLFKSSLTVFLHVRSMQADSRCNFQWQLFTSQAETFLHVVRNFRVKSGYFCQIMPVKHASLKFYRVHLLNSEQIIFVNWCLWNMILLLNVLHCSTNRFILIFQHLNLHFHDGKCFRTPFMIL